MYTCTQRSLSVSVCVPRAVAGLCLFYSSPEYNVTVLATHKEVSAPKIRNIYTVMMIVVEIIFFLRHRLKKSAERERERES